MCYIYVSILIYIMVLPTKQNVYNNPITNENKAKYLKVILQRYVNPEFIFTTSYTSLFQSSPGSTALSPNANTSTAITLYNNFYDGFEQTTNVSNGTPTITLLNQYICPYTGYSGDVQTIEETSPTLQTIDLACVNLSILASTFKQNIMGNKYGRIDYDLSKYNNTTTALANLTVSLNTDIIAKPDLDVNDLNQSKTLAAYQSLIYYTDYAILQLWSFMKEGLKRDDNITCMPFYEGSANFILGHYSSAWLTYLKTLSTPIDYFDTENKYIGLNNTFPSRNSIRNKPEYIAYKKYVLYARDLLKQLFNQSNFGTYNTKEDKPGSINGLNTQRQISYSVYEVLKKGIQSISVGIVAFEFDNTYNPTVVATLTNANDYAQPIVGYSPGDYFYADVRYCSKTCGNNRDQYCKIGINNPTAERPFNSNQQITSSNACGANEYYGSLLNKLDSKLQVSAKQYTRAVSEYNREVITCVNYIVGVGVLFGYIYVNNLLLPS